jgi:hypothetical protein
VKLSFFKNPKILAYIILIFFILFYLLTLAPSVTFIDSGELGAVCCIPGIAHPTGYPLFTLLGYLFSNIPFIYSEIYKLNLMAGVFCSVALFFIFKLMLSFNVKINQPQHERTKVKVEIKKKIQRKNTPDIYKAVDSNLLLISSVFAVLVLGLSKNFWEQSTAIEVYSLHCLFISILLFSFAKSIIKKFEGKIEKSSFFRREGGWLIFGLLLGMSFTNHMSTIFLLPGFAFLYFRTYGFKSSAFKRLFWMVIPFLLGLSLYFYLPIRASQNPEINWGNPVNWEYFLRHISGRQYQVWVFSSLAGAMKQLKYFINTVPADFVYFPIILSLFGIVYLYQRSKDIFYFTIILFLSCTLLAINYDINDIDSYFLLSYFIISVWAGFGVIKLFVYLRSKFKNIKMSHIYLFLIIPLIQLINFSDVNESNNYLVHDYTMNVFNSVKENGIVISFQWDNWISASLYFQHVKGIRKDIVVIDKELLRRSWYFNQLERNYPWFVEKSKLEISEFLKELYKFEKDIPYDPLTIQTKYINMINSFIEKNFTTRPVYVGSEIEPEIGNKYKRIPEGLLFRLYQDNIYHEFPIIEYNYRSLKKKDRLIEQITRFYAIMFTDRASYENFYGYKERAMWYLNKALEIYPTFPQALALRNQLK